MVKMAIPLKNQVFEKIKDKGGLTDKELVKILVKNEIIIPDSEFNKILLDLEIMGLITVSWMTKDSKRIDIVSVKEEEDEYEEQIKNTNEKDYEASFPGTD
jgi:hypothetical protein|tara:strand:- start:2277 stop:2579 length:303 start_codon:yes stop_codon:yes gene_type:complete